MYYLIIWPYHNQAHICVIVYYNVSVIIGHTVYTLEFNADY